jgi:ABC-type polysaccharide transport system permease subunit
VLQLHGHWRRWYVRAPVDAAPTLVLVRAQLRESAWLDGAAKHKHLARTTLPLVLGATGVAGLLLLLVLRRLGSAGL